MQNPVIIIGAKGLGKVALDIFKSNSVDIYCLLDDDEALHGKEIGEVSILGRTDDEEFLKLIGKNTEAFVATDDNKYKKSVTESLIERNVMPVNAIHKTAHISEYAAIGHGNLLNAGSVAGAGAKIGNHCIIHANAVVDFDAEVQDFVQIGAGAIINSGAIIEEGAFIGAGSIIISGVTVGKNARVGAGSVVIASVKNKETVFGNPAQPLSKS